MTTKTVGNESISHLPYFFFRIGEAKERSEQEGKEEFSLPASIILRGSAAFPKLFLSTSLKEEEQKKKIVTNIWVSFINHRVYLIFLSYPNFFGFLLRLHVIKTGSIVPPPPKKEPAIIKLANRALFRLNWLFHLQCSLFNDQTDYHNL